MGLFDFFSALGSIFSTIYTNEKNSYNAYLQREWEEDMMDKQNAYNDPSLQVERLQKAGINPIAGTMANGLTVTGNTSAGHNAVGLPNVQDPALALAQFMAGISGAKKSSEEALSEKTFRSARLDQIQSQNDKIRAEVVNLGASTEAQQIANKYADAREQWALAGKKSDVYLTYAQVASTNQIARKTAQEIKNLVSQNVKTETEIQLNYLNMDDVLAHIASQYKDIELKESEIVKNQAQTDVFHAQEHNINASTDLLNAETDLKTQESQRYGEVTDKVIAQYDAAISQIQAVTGKTRQEAYWIWFDKVESQSISIFGNKMSQTRFGKRQLRRQANKMISNYPENFEY